MTDLKTYATLEQMQQMEFGVTGITRMVGDCPVQCELLVGENGLYGWAARSNDANGDMVDWDRVPEEDARELGLI